jgi:membrane-associated phospholipid phosphatase
MLAGHPSSLDRKPVAYRLRPHDLVWASVSLLFALFSLLWHDTGIIRAGGLSLPRGFALAAAYLCVAALSLLAPLVQPLASRLAGPEGDAASAKGLGLAARARRLGSRLLLFLRTYYPQAFFALFFTDAILLSAQAFGGHSHDDFFAAADFAIFGFQPAREFSRLLGSVAWINEIMYFAYFSYFAFMVIAVWIPYLKGDRAEGERQLFAVSATFAVVCVWYVFFRVQGPKYWLPDLRQAWYDGIDGGFFVDLFKRSLAKTTLSGAAFPSMHVILTLTTLTLAFRNDRRFFALYLPVALLILCATIYIFAHWVTDILGGVIVALVLPPLFYALHGAIGRRARAGLPGSTN